MHLLTFLPLSLLLPQTSAWGFLGHRTVAYLAQLHFTPTAHDWVTSLLPPGQDISDAAVWPDEIAHLPEYRYTKAWHYIDANDDPPRTCTLNFARDCVGSCIIGALMNHTARVQDVDLDIVDRGESLKFVMHFVGDLHQPLHTELMERGGNGVQVVFDGMETNLHSTWDTLIPRKRVGIWDEKLGARVWAARLFEDTEVRECTNDIKACSLGWGEESNQLVCSYVLRSEEALEEDLGREYYWGAVPIVDMQVQRAGRRLAAWINMMAAVAEEEEIQIQELK